MKRSYNQVSGSMMLSEKALHPQSPTAQKGKELLRVEMGMTTLDE